MIIDTTVLLCATGHECDGAEPCQALCHPAPAEPSVGEFID